MNMIHPKKKFGQNFLVNWAVLNRLEKEIASFLEFTNPKHILEIGPGTGQLTEILIKSNFPVTCVEIDPEAIEYLKNRFEVQNNSRLDVTLGDMSELIYDKHFMQTFETKTVLIANLPFNIGSRILVDLAVVKPDVSFLVILQKEVALKVVNPNLSTLFSLWIGLFWDCEKVIDISKNAFEPQPNVMSSLLKGIPKKQNTLYEVNSFFQMCLETQQKREKTLRFLKVLTAHPRKTVVQNLILAGFSRTMLEDLLTAEGFDNKTRLNRQNYRDILKVVHRLETSERGFVA